MSDRPLPSRRSCLSDLGMGFTGLALGAMLRRDAYANEREWAPPDGRPHFEPKAKSVIWLFMNGGVSHMESFDPKPALNRYAGKTIAQTPYADVQDPEKLEIERLVVPDVNGNQRDEIYPLQTGYRRHGPDGIEVSDWFPYIAGQVDKIAIVRSMWTTDSNHGAQVQFHSGRHQNDGKFPTLGAWVHYGLGTLDANLPQFISMGTRPRWNSSDSLYLGAEYESVPLRVAPGKDPFDYASAEVSPGSSRGLPLCDRTRREGLDLVRQLNLLRGKEYPDDPALDARIASYEMAYRMQTAVPGVVDISREPEATKTLYGLDKPHCREFGTQLLAARRFVERGVRFVQIQHGGGGAGKWDAHKDLKKRHTRDALAVDQPIAALLIDLERRGLLDETLVVFVTEFGRTPGSQSANGRDHHIFGFSVWMAGGGLKRGVVHGATDELGFHAVESPHYVTDVHATILHQLGLDSRRLEIPGRKRLDVDHGNPITEIMA